MTNHHVGAGDLEKVSTPEKNYLRDGFHAKTNAEEIKCKGLELNVLIGIKEPIEWQVPTPVPVNNFEQIPIFDSDPYDYGTPLDVSGAVAALSGA